MSELERLLEIMSDNIENGDFEEYNSNTMYNGEIIEI